MGQKKPETALVAACLQLLALRRVFAWRNNSGAFVLGSGADRRFFRAGLVGGSDILGIITRPCGCGVLLAVECKVGNGRLTPAQNAFLETVKLAGGLSLIVRDVAELDEALRLEGVG